MITPFYFGIICGILIGWFTGYEFWVLCVSKWKGKKKNGK